MGGANLLPATVTGAGPPAVLEVPGIGTVQAAGPATVGTALHLALRPERLCLGGEADNQVRGTVAETAYRGDVLDIAVVVQGGPTLHVAHPLQQGAGALPGPGDSVLVTWRPEACVLLAR